MFMLYLKQIKIEKRMKIYHEMKSRLAFACARTADGCENILKNLKESENNIEFQALITENSFHPSHTHPYRGFTLLNSSESSTTIKVNNFSIFFFLYFYFFF